MNVWAGPYLKVISSGGEQRWALPRPLPLPAGAGTDPDLHPVMDPDGLGLPARGQLQVRWRAPGFRHPRKRTFTLPEQTAEAVGLACDVARASAASGSGWSCGPSGAPVPQPAPAAETVGAAGGPAAEAAAAGMLPAVPTAPDRVDEAGEVEVAAAVLVPAVISSAALTGLDAQWLTAHVLDPSSRTIVSPDNLILQAVLAGRAGLGSTWHDLIGAFKKERWDSWSPQHRGNAISVLGLVDHLMRYREPWEEDEPDVAAWKRARLNVPGVEEGDSLHVRLTLHPDLKDAVALRRSSDRRIDALNEQAIRRHEQAWARYLQAQQARAEGRRRGGRMPERPPEQLLLRAQPEVVSARTEELFATYLSAVLAMAERRGDLIGPNPWLAFAPKGRPHVGYRRPRPLQIKERAVLPIGRVVDLAEHIATLGPLDPRTGRPRGDRLRALVLASTAAGRPSEYAALRPGDYVPAGPGEEPTLYLSRSAGPVATGANDGASWHVADRLKDRDPGEERPVGLATAVAEAIEEHLARGYASEDRLFTGPEGGPLRLGNLVDTYWRPAVQHVCGRASEPLVRNLEFRWLRKGAITWMLRAGLDLGTVADLAGHSPLVLLAHYAGVVASGPDRHIWTDWDAAWAWASQERDLT